jgi:F420-dependent oxidoreductase-like protein
MHIGLIVPNGWTGEYDGWDPASAWRRSVEVAQLAERLGFQSLWSWDHVHTLQLVRPEGAAYPTLLPDPTDEMTFEAWTMLAALAPQTSRVRLGQVVTCAGFRNPALLAKMAATLDLVSGGRAVLGIGAGWKQEEWEAYGYQFPPLAERLTRLGETLEIVTRLLRPGRERATFEGRHHRVRGAINLPRPVQQPRLPVMVGGNGPNVTWRLAARFADELNLDNMPPGELRDKLPLIHARCEEVGRDPATLALSGLIFWGDAAVRGQERVDRLGAYRELGLSRVMCLLQESTRSDEPVHAFVEDALTAGCELELGIGGQIPEAPPTLA